MNILLWAVGTYFIAAVPYSLILGYLVTGDDIRNYGDGNPGATNVKRASGSIFWMIIAVIFDAGKGLFPVGLAYWILGWRGLEIVPIALAAVCGHAFSVFLKFRGGKSVAVTIGIWIGLLIFEAALVLPALLTYCYFTVKESDWAVFFWILCFSLYLLLTQRDNLPLLLVWLGNTLILLYHHREGLKQPPTLRLLAGKNS